MGEVEGRKRIWSKCIIYEKYFKSNTYFYYILKILMHLHDLPLDMTSFHLYYYNLYAYRMYILFQYPVTSCYFGISFKSNMNIIFQC